MLATYDRTRVYTSTDATYNNYNDNYQLNDYFIYGVSRLGSEIEQLTLVNQNFRQAKALSKDVEIAPSWQAITGGIALLAPDYTRRVLGKKRYELSNLPITIGIGNVLEVISDRKVRFTDNGSLVYAADVISYSDYSPIWNAVGYASWK